MGEPRELSRNALYWIIREQRARAREAAENRQARETALEIGELINETKERLIDEVEPLFEVIAENKDAGTIAEILSVFEPWTNTARQKYIDRKRRELMGDTRPRSTQDPQKAAREAAENSARRAINHAKIITRTLDELSLELALDEENALRSSLETSVKRVAKSIADEFKAEKTAREKHDPSGKESQKASKKTVGGQNFDAQFETLNAGQIKRTVYASWDGADFSDRIWANKDKLLKNLKATLKDAVIQGYGAEEVSRRFAREMGVHFNNALRLIRTETNRVLNETTAEQLKKAGAKFYRFVAIMDSRTSPICAALNGKVFPFEKREIGINAPPMHPNCRSTIVLDDGQKKAKDGESGDEIDTTWIDDLFRDWVQDVTKEAAVHADSQKEAEQIIETGQSALKSATAANVQRVSDLENEQSAKKQSFFVKMIDSVRRKASLPFAAPKKQKTQQEIEAETLHMATRAIAHPFREAIQNSIFLKLASIENKRTTAKKRNKAVREAIIKSVLDSLANETMLVLNEEITSKEKNLLKKQLSYYKTLLKHTLMDDYESAKKAIKKYLSQIGIDDPERQNAFLAAYSEKFHTQALPPMLVTINLPNDNRAFYFKGLIRLNKNANDWNGHRVTLQHEFGHYADEAIFMRKYRNKNNEEHRLESIKITEDPFHLQAAFAADLKQLKIDDPPNSPSFKLWGQKFKIGDFKKNQEYGKNVARLAFAVYNTLHGGETRDTKVVDRDLESRLYISQTLDAIQSLVGVDYGDGHLEKYVELREGAYIETVAQVYSSIVSGYDFLRALLPKSTAIIRKRIK